MQRHYQAQDCHDCDAFLQLGIDAHNWLRLAAEQIRSAIADGRLQPSQEMDSAVDVLYHLWLRPIDIANQWISLQLDRGFDLENLDKFRAAENAVKQYVAAADKRNELAARVPPPEDLLLIAVDPAEWLSEPAWIQ